MVNFEPFKSLFMLTFSHSRAAITGIPLLPPLFTYPLRNWYQRLYMYSCSIHVHNYCKCTCTVGKPWFSVWASMYQIMIYCTCRKVYLMHTYIFDEKYIAMYILIILLSSSITMVDDHSTGKRQVQEMVYLLWGSN